MTAPGILAAQQKMQKAGVNPVAIDVFSHYYGQLAAGATGIIAEDSIEALTTPAMLADLSVDEEHQRAAIRATAIIKLNGGLGTSMGLDQAKTLLEVRDGLSFLDLIVGQVMAARRHYGAAVPLLLMNSFRTRADSLEALGRHAGIEVDGLPLDFIQNMEPKLRADDFTPVEWPSDPSLEWCPPGHGDLYTALLGSGVLDLLLERGYKYASVSNGDNLGAAPNATIAGWFAASGAPYAAEVCRRTINDKKGGHLAIRKADQQLILRDTAQTAPEEMDFFTDEHRHPYFHTNNLWFDLQVLRRVLNERGGVLGLPMIRNEKTVDPSDPQSTPVVQIESAMGAAIEVFEGAQAICVGRERFLPVKTTNELLLLRSDVYALDAEKRLVAGVELPEINLSKHYKTIQGFEARIPHPPSLVEAKELTVQGDWTFGEDVVVKGRVTLPPTRVPSEISPGTVLEG